MGNQSTHGLKLLSDADLPKRPTYDVLDLVGLEGEVDLRHNDQIYRLRITRAGKLILTK